MKISKLFTCVRVALVLTTTSSLAQSPPEELKKEGIEFRRKIYDAFKKKQLQDANRITELIDECEKFPFRGRNLSDLNTILSAAGQKQDFFPFKSSTAGPNDLAGGMLLEKGGEYSAVFNMVVRVPRPVAGKERKVDRVVTCNVLTTSF